MKSYTSLVFLMFLLVTMTPAGVSCAQRTAEDGARGPLQVASGNVAHFAVHIETTQPDKGSANNIVVSITNTGKSPLPYSSGSEYMFHIELKVRAFQTTSWKVCRAKAPESDDAYTKFLN